MAKRKPKVGGPWKTLGLSRTEYYRRKKDGTLDTDGGERRPRRGRPPRLIPTAADLALWPVLLARDPKSPSGLCWRDRPRSRFRLESDWSSWTVKWAWKPAGTLSDGRWRVTTGGANGRRFLAEDIVAALKAMGDDTLRSDADAMLTPLAERWRTSSKTPAAAQA